MSNHLSLFDGMSCAQLALKASGIEIDNYYASEIDKPAIAATNHNFPGTIQLGDINDWRNWDIDFSTIDHVFAGSPCQGFSSIGSGEGFDHEGSKLFFVFIEILNEIKSRNPKVKFLLENVRMDTVSENTITRILGVSPVFINSEIHSPCSRPRLYWANFGISQPERVDLTFGDFIDYSISETNLSKGWIKWWDSSKEKQLKKGYSKLVEPNEKGICLLARQYACWAGNFVKTPSGLLRKPTKNELALLVGAPADYFEVSSHSQAAKMTGNGWDVRTASHIFSEMKKEKPNDTPYQIDVFEDAA